MIDYFSQVGRVGIDKAEGEKKKNPKVKPSEDFLEQMPLFHAKH